MQKKTKSKMKQTDSIYKKIKDRWTLILFGGIVFYFSFIILRGEVKKYFLKHNSIELKAVIVDEKNYWGNSPVSQTFSYSYEFIIEGKKYQEDSHDSSLRVGDSVLIRYVSFYPNFSEMIEVKKN